MTDLKSAQKQKIEWRNWSGNQTSAPAQFVQPTSLDALRDHLLSAKGPVRTVGAGHSFTPVARTDGTLLNLDKMTGIISVDKGRQTARVHAGSRLKDLSPALEAQGLAFKNLGDIDVQSLAGATSTATHGTGQGFPCLSAELQAIKLMTASGDLVEYDAVSTPDALNAAQVSLGALGIMVEAEVALRPAYKLHRKTFMEPIDDIIDQMESRWNTHRNYEAFYFPHSGYGMNVIHDETDAASPPSEDEDDDMGALIHIRDTLKNDPVARRRKLDQAISKVQAFECIGTSWKLLANERNTLFNEMEYHLPPDIALDALREVITVINRDRPDVFFPIEIRKTAGDDAWLSPFQGGPRVSIAVHAHGPDPFDWLFTHIEPIFKAAGGRPHWGKLHSLTAPDLAALYPDFEKFCALRQSLDPNRKFLTPSFAKLWGED